MAAAFVVAQGQPVLIDRFLEDATEVDVDAIADGEQVIVAGIMEHIEEAGVHSGDSACAIPPYSLPGPVVAEIREATCLLARHLNVKGLMNIQFAVKKEDGRPVVYILEVNPAGQPHGAVRLQGHRHAAGQGGRQGDGRRLAGRAGLPPRPDPQPRLGQGGRLPVRQVRRRRHRAGAGDEIDRRGDGHQRAVLDRLRQEPAGRRHGAARRAARSSSAWPSGPKEHMVGLARRLEKMGFELLATRGTAERLEAAGIRVQRLMKLSQGHPNVLDYMVNGDLRLVMNTPSGKGARTDEGRIRAAAVSHGIPCITTIQAADAAVLAMEALRQEEMTVQAIQDRFPRKAPGGSP